MGQTKTRQWTLQVMPDNGGSVRTMRVSRRLVRIAVISAAALLVLAVTFVADLAVGAKREAHLALLQSENHHLRQNLGQIQGQVTALTGSVDRLTAGDQRVRLLAGLAPIDPQVQAVGIGGPPVVDPVREEFFRVSAELAGQTYGTQYDVEKLTRRAELLSVSLSEALDSLRMHEEIFLARPSVLPVQTDQAWISSSFSRSRYHPILQYNRPHEGIDISAQSGSPILATANGTVVFAGTNGGYGKMIDVDHGYGYRTRYAHARSVSVRAGQQVRRGDQLGEVGRTGLVNAPSLHYEVMVNDRAVNPREFFLDGNIPE